jgi:phosphoglycerate dehydrogenase-like enzyme
MLRVGYPDFIPASYISQLPAGIELIPLSQTIAGEVAIDAWIVAPHLEHTQAVWTHLRGVKLILGMMAGIDWLVPIVGEKITICNARGAHNIATAEWTISAILTVLKYFPFYQQLQQSKQAWKQRFAATKHYQQISGDTQQHFPPMLLEELHGKKVLLVGFGAIGQQIARLLEPFDVQLTRVAHHARQNPTVHPVNELNTLLPEAEILILILPLTAESRHLIGAQQLALLPQGALVVNAARGPIVDTDALVRSLHAGRIRAALDVSDPEPLPEDHPLWDCPNLFLTPHIAAANRQFIPRAIQSISAELSRYVEGKPLENVIQAGVTVSVVR